MTRMRQGPAGAPIPIRGWDLISDSRPLFPVRSKQRRSTGSVDQAVPANVRPCAPGDWASIVSSAARIARSPSAPPARSPLNDARLAAAWPTLRPEALRIRLWRLAGGPGWPEVVARSRRSKLARPSLRLGHAVRAAGACCMQGPRRQDSHTPKPRRNRPRRLSQHSRLLCSARTARARVSRPHDQHRVADRPQRMPQFGCGQDGWSGAIASPTGDCARTRAAARNERRHRPHAAAVGGSARRLGRRAKHTAGEVDTEERGPGGGSGRSGLGGRRARRGARDVELRDLPGAVLVGLFSYPAGAHGTGY